MYNILNIFQTWLGPFKGPANMIYLGSGRHFFNFPKNVQKQCMELFEGLKLDLTAVTNVCLPVLTPDVS
jgi:hypothetical protein